MGARLAVGMAVATTAVAMAAWVEGVAAVMTEAAKVQERSVMAWQAVVAAATAAAVETVDAAASCHM